MTNFWEDLPKPFLILAPMEGVTDKVFRAVVERAGAPDVFYTEFTNVSSFASERGRENALERLEINPNEGKHVHNGTPIVAQIWGKNPEQFALLASQLEELGFDGLDLNMGCPDKNVCKTGGGSGMIRTPELAVECIRQAKSATNLPVSVKTRLGYSRIDEFREWLPTLLRENLATLTVHLRTKKEMSKVGAHFDLIPEIIKLRDEIAPQTKLVINGDIENREHALKLHKKYPEIDGFMIGRGVFKDIGCFRNKFDTCPKTNCTNLFLYHLDLFDARRTELEAKGQKYPFEPLKHFYKVYFNSTPNSSDLRQKLMACNTTDELREVIRNTSFELD
ncbi:MAG: tRNA-dihydrouridine synthase family protein [Candidatus Saccharibacteria bacterium]|nr:tRNA-dihydrouridine synthase family protein [Candidatus Saccharibacteria bacterium]